jgi:hypothetical protein
MNEKYKQKSEGKIVVDLFDDNRSKAQRLLDEVKQREKRKKLVPVKFGIRTIYFVPEGIDMENWEREKKRNLEKFTHND